MLVAHLADFHAYILCLDEESTRKWKERYHGYPINKSGFDMFFANNCEKLVEMDRARFETPFRRLKRAIVELDFLHYVTTGCLEELSLPELMINGDFHTQNILWKTVDSGELTDEVAAVLDWQVVHRGNGFVDMARVVLVCTSAEIRRHLDTYIVEFYYDRLSSCVAARGGPPLSFSLEQAKKAFKLALMNELRVSTFWVPFFAQAGSSFISILVAGSNCWLALVLEACRRRSGEGGRVQPQSGCSSRPFRGGTRRLRPVCQRSRASVA